MHPLHHVLLGPSTCDLVTVCLLEDGIEYKVMNTRVSKIKNSYSYLKSIFDAVTQRHQTCSISFTIQECKLRAVTLLLK